MPTAADLDLDLHADARVLVRRRCEEGARRVVVWGPPGVGRTSFLARLASESPFDLSRVHETDDHDSPPNHALIDALTAHDARVALTSWSGEGALVVASIGRAGLDADAFVELTPLCLDTSVRFVTALLRRDGVTLDDAAIRSLATHAEGLPGALVRAATLVRVLTPTALLARCEAARDRLVTFGTIIDHPMFPTSLEPNVAPDTGADVDPDTGADLDPVARRAAVLLLAAGAPVAPATFEQWSPSSLDALLTLRDHALLRGGDELTLLHGPARRLALHPSFTDDFATAADRLDAHAHRLALDARERWITRGDEDALRELAHHEGLLRRATERALTELTEPTHLTEPTDRTEPTEPTELSDRTERTDRDDAHHADVLPTHRIERVVALVLALQSRAEIHVGPKPRPELERAYVLLGSRSPELALERARACRLAGDFETFERTHTAIDSSALPLRFAARWWSEHAQAHRLHRRLDDAVDALERALALFTQSDLELEAARATIDLGGMRYWQQRFDEAVVLYTRGRTIAARLGAKRTEAIALSNLCLCHSFAGDDAAADRAGRAAVALFEALGDSGALGTSLGHLGILAYQYGRLDDAERHFVAAEARVSEAGYFEQHVYVRFNRTCVAIGSGRLDDAQALLDSLPTLLAASPSPLVAMHLERITSDLFEARGRFADALAALVRGIAIARRDAASDVEAQLEAQRSRVLARMGAVDESAAADARARDALTLVTRPPLRAASELVLDHATYLRARLRGEAASIERLAIALRPTWEGLGARTEIGVSAADAGGVRDAARAFFADLDAIERVAVEWRARDPECTAICVDPSTERARLPGGVELDATNRRNAFRVLRLLAEAGELGIERDALVEGVWPGERMRDDAASNRLHNALAQLRSAGLAAHLARDGSRYRLEGVAVKIARGLPEL